MSFIRLIKRLVIPLSAWLERIKRREMGKSEKATILKFYNWKNKEKKIYTIYDDVITYA